MDVDERIGILTKRLLEGAAVVAIGKTGIQDNRVELLVITKDGVDMSHELVEEAGLKASVSRYPRPFLERLARRQLGSALTGWALNIAALDIEPLYDPTGFFIRLKKILELHLLSDEAVREIVREKLGFVTEVTMKAMKYLQVGDYGNVAEMAWRSMNWGLVPALFIVNGRIPPPRRNVETELKSIKLRTSNLLRNYIMVNMQEDLTKEYADRIIDDAKRYIEEITKLAEEIIRDP